MMDLLEFVIIIGGGGVLLYLATKIVVYTFYKTKNQFNKEE